MCEGRRSRQLEVSGMEDVSESNAVDMAGWLESV